MVWGCGQHTDCQLPRRLWPGQVREAAWAFYKLIHQELEPTAGVEKGG